MPDVGQVVAKVAPGGGVEITVIPADDDAVVPDLRASQDAAIAAVAADE